MTYQYKITNTYHYNGYPQSEDMYTVESAYFNASLHHYGNQGFDIPVVSSAQKNNGYYWSLHRFMTAFYADDKFASQIRNLKANETITVVLSSEP